MSISNLIQRAKISDHKIAKVIRFGITGLIATVIQYAVYLLLLNLFSFSPVLSIVVSYLLSFLANFFLSNFFTFRTTPTKRNALYFTISHLVNLGLQTILISAFSRIINPEYALLPTLAICVPCNFLMVQFSLKSNRVQFTE